MKKHIGTIFAILGILILFCTVRVGAQQEVNVRIASYPTEINGINVANRDVEYPLINYRDITYFPMTYNLCARLGLTTGYEQNSGFYIVSYNAITDGDRAELFGSAANNSFDKYYIATIPEYPVYLNGIRIDSTKEEYPLLNFRNITYFPMTYKFATEELGFVTEWSFENGFRLSRKDGYGNDVYIGKDDNEGVNIIVSTYAPDAVILPDGSQLLSVRFLYDRYKILYDGNNVIKLDSSTELREDDYSEPPSRPLPGYDKITLEDGILRYMDKNILDLSDTDAIGLYSTEYTFEDISFIHTNVQFGNAPAPYTQHEEYIFVIVGDDIKHLAAWDGKNNLSNIFPDGSGGYYLCSDSYSPARSSRWSTSFACVYRYTSDEDFYEVTIPDTNSLTALGTYGDKLYVKAMYYAGNKSMAVNSPLPISAVNSGYYEIDSKTGNVVKLYPYVHGKTILTDTGRLYLVTKNGMKMRVVDLITREIVEA